MVSPRHGSLITSRVSFEAMVFIEHVNFKTSGLSKARDHNGFLLCSED